MAAALNPSRFRSHGSQQGTFLAYNPRGGRSRPVSPFSHPGPDIVVSTPVDPFASTNTCPPGWVWRRNSVGGWDCSPSVLAAQGPASNPYVGPWPWGMGGWGSWRAPVPQSYGVQRGAGDFSSSVGPGPGGPIAFPGPYESPEQAATVAASYIDSRGGYPFGG